jgi:hypothetical protein
MSAQLRYTTARGKLGSPVVYDTEGKRPVLVCLRAVGAEELTASGAADEAAMRMAHTCAGALNRADAEERWRKGQEGGGR